MSRDKEDVTKYVEWQCQNKCIVLSVKPEYTFDEFGQSTTVWNIKTDTEGDWWVVEGSELPMNLYPQAAYYFSADEVYSFHLGLMLRMSGTKNEFNPEDYINAVTQNAEIAPLFLRKLKIVAESLDKAIEIEHFHAIGVHCRETLIELCQTYYAPEMARDNEQPKGADFKNKIEYFLQFSMVGSKNSDYRTYLKKFSEVVWDYSAKLVHSQNSSVYDASTCVSMCITFVSAIENLIQKQKDIGIRCPYCKSNSVNIFHIDSAEEGKNAVIFYKCNECGNDSKIELK